MKNTILRTLTQAIVFSLISGIVVVITGIILGWKTSAQFSDGFFWVGAILISLGMVNILGMRYQPSGHLDAADRFKIWQVDTLRGYHLLAFLGTSGLLLFGLSGLAILIGRLF